MACCWFRNELAGVISPVPFAEGTDGWCDFTHSGDVTPHDLYFSGFPDFLQGESAILAWNGYVSSLSQYAESFLRWHHNGFVDSFRFARSNLRQRTGGLHPCVVLVVPDGYMHYYTPLYDNKFHFSSGIDLRGDLNTTIPRQIKAQTYYTDFIAARNLGFPRWPDDGDPRKPQSTSELDIDINFSFVFFRNLDRAGGSWVHTNVLLSQFGGACHSEFVVKIPERDLGMFESLVVPIITVDYMTWTTGQLNQSTEYLITQYAHTAGPAPNVQDMSVIEGLNRIYPARTDDTEVGLKINDQVVDWTDSDFTDDLHVSNLIDLMRCMPVQEWSAPSDIQLYQMGVPDATP